MANLFRCLPNLIKRDYILKAGVSQGSYNYKTLTYKEGNGTFVYSASSVNANIYATCAVYYNFNASKWNKLYITKTYASGFKSSGVIGVCTNANPSVYGFEDSAVWSYASWESTKDYVLDISNLTGECSFYIYVKSVESSDSTRAVISINGDVYLSEK